jgi:hypothetical protein
MHCQTLCRTPAIRTNDRLFKGLGYNTLSSVAVKRDLTEAMG